MRLWLTIIFVLALAMPALAQNSSNSTTTTTTTQQQSQPAQSSSSGSSTKQTTTSQTTQPTTTTQRTTGVDPIWLAVGGIALITIIAIALLAMRGRSRDTVSVRESKTVVKE